MKVHKPGTMIKIKLSSIDAFISEIIIGDGYVFYQVSYFYNGDLKIPRLSDYEFDVIEGTKKQIGFK